MLKPKFLSKAPIAMKQQPKAIAGKGDELLSNPDVGRLFLGG